MSDLVERLRENAAYWNGKSQIHVSVLDFAKAADEIERLRGQLVKAHAVLEQCQDCIRGETPEDMTDQEAREDTISKIREIILGE